MKLKPFSTIGEEEKKAVMRVMDSQLLSGFLAQEGPEFLGGPEVQALEKEFAQYFGTQHSISFNSASSALYAALSAIGIQKGDEIIVSPFSMSVSAVSPFEFGAIPIFADIDPNTFSLSPQSVSEKITDKTKAIITVNLFGIPGPLSELKEIAQKNHLYLIEDNAQAPGAQLNHQFTGTFGDIGILSLNRHKHIQCGEGGLALCNDLKLATNMQLYRNHAECIPQKNIQFAKQWGFNLRMTEIQAAIAREQLKKLERIVLKKRKTALFWNKLLEEHDEFQTYQEVNNARAVYYLFPILIKSHFVAHQFIQSFKEYGLAVSQYVKPLYTLPIFQNFYENHPSKKPDCPQLESVIPQLLCFPWCAYDLDENDIEFIHDILIKISNQAH